MIEDFEIDLARMMENAGLALARLARRRFLGGDPRNQVVLILAGTGGNGGGGLVAARRLYNWGADVHVHTTAAAGAFEGVPARQLAILRRVGVPVTAIEPVLPPADLIIDALIGYSLSGAPRGVAAQLIVAANAHGAPILSLDTPSGVDTTGGQVHTPAIKAAATLTLALPKTGLLAEDAAGAVGELYVADISVPPSLYKRPPLNLDVGPIFALDDIIRLR